ncbi:hypothetical protein QTV49_000296 [Vibrio vulnificus]|nr:hypothetical protein [Vibrio vulnificus]
MFSLNGQSFLGEKSRPRANFFLEITNSLKKIFSMNIDSDESLERKVIAEKALIEAFDEYSIEHLRCLSAIRLAADEVVRCPSVPINKLSNIIKSIAYSRRSPFRSQMMDLCASENVSQKVVSNVISTLDALNDAYVVFGLSGLPLVACEIKWLKPQKLLSKCLESSVVDYLNRPEGRGWACVFKDPTKYSNNEMDFFDEVVLNLSDTFSPADSLAIANCVLRAGGVKDGRACLRTVVISTEKPTYVALAEDITDWRAVAALVAESLKRIDVNRLERYQKVPKTEIFTINLDIELPKDLAPIHKAPYKLRFKVQDWIHGKGADAAKRLPSKLLISWEDVSSRCPDFVLENFSKEQILQYLSNKLNKEIDSSIRKFKNQNQLNRGGGGRYFYGEYYFAENGTDGLLDEIISRFINKAFPDPSCVESIMRSSVDRERNKTLAISESKVE